MIWRLLVFLSLSLAVLKAAQNKPWIEEIESRDLPLLIEALSRAGVSSSQSRVGFLIRNESTYSSFEKERTQERQAYEITVQRLLNDQWKKSSNSNSFLFLVWTQDSAVKKGEKIQDLMAYEFNLAKHSRLSFDKSYSFDALMYSLSIGETPEELKKIPLDFSYSQNYGELGSMAQFLIKGEAMDWLELIQARYGIQLEITMSGSHPVHRYREAEGEWIESRLNGVQKILSGGKTVHFRLRLRQLNLKSGIQKQYFAVILQSYSPRKLKLILPQKEIDKPVSWFDFEVSEPGMHKIQFLHCASEMDFLRYLEKDREQLSELAPLEQNLWLRDELGKALELDYQVVMEPVLAKIRKNPLRYLAEEILPLKEKRMRSSGERHFSHYLMQQTSSAVGLGWVDLPIVVLTKGQ